MSNFRQTQFDPTVSQQYQGPTGAKGINLASMEESLAREMSKMKISDEKRQREVEKICGESDELKELQARIRHAYLNKERAAQQTEGQFRKQVELEQDAHIDAHYLKNKEYQDRLDRELAAEKTKNLVQNKQHIQDQIRQQEEVRAEAYAEYVKEKQQVDNVIRKMIDEDTEMGRIIGQKKEQAQADMQLSQQEKRALLRRQKELEEYEDEMVRRYAAQQQMRQDEIQGMKAAAEEKREALLLQLAAEEEQRRFEKEFQENLRNELYVQEKEEAALAQERADIARKNAVREELQAAKEFQARLKAERAAEEKRLEDEFKDKLMAKFAEDERLEQMNAQKRRMRELEHKREIERLWQDRLTVYAAQREIEEAERMTKKQEELRQMSIVQMEKERLLAEHAMVLQHHHPKASAMYTTQQRM